MKTLRLVAILLASLEAGWIAWDGAQSLATGRYLTPRLGDYGGRTGAWTRVASSLGLPPRSRGARAALLIYGGAWLVAIDAFRRRSAWGWWGTFVGAGGAIWYSSLVVPLSLTVMLLLIPMRGDA